MSLDVLYSWELPRDIHFGQQWREENGVEGRKLKFLGVTFYRSLSCSHVSIMWKELLLNAKLIGSTENSYDYYVCYFII